MAAAISPEKENLLDVYFFPIEFSVDFDKRLLRQYGFLGVNKFVDELTERHVLLHMWYMIECLSE